MSQALLLNIAVENILEYEGYALRKVDGKSEDFQALTASIDNNGVLNGICVRPAFEEDGETQMTAKNGGLLYYVIDGLQRLTSCRHLGIETIPAQVRTGDEAIVVMKLQMVANLHLVKMKPAAYGAQLTRMLQIDKSLTIKSIANDLSVTPKFVSERLKLGKLHPDVAKIVDRGEISLTNAIQLAKLPTDEQVDWVEKATGDASGVFTADVAARLRSLRKDAREGSSEKEFVPTPHMRRIKEILAELETLTFLEASMQAGGVTDPNDAARYALGWVLSLDEESVAKAKAEFDAAETSRAQARAKRAQERADKRKAEADAEAKALGVG